MWLSFGSNNHNPFIYNNAMHPRVLEFKFPPHTYISVNLEFVNFEVIWLKRNFSQLQIPTKKVAMRHKVPPDKNHRNKISV